MTGPTPSSSRPARLRAALLLGWSVWAIAGSALAAPGAKVSVPSAPAVAPKAAPALTPPAKPLKSYPARNDDAAYRISIALNGQVIGQIRSQVPAGAETAEVANRTVKGKSQVEAFAHLMAIPDDARDGAMLLRLQGGANAIGPADHKVSLTFQDMVSVMPRETTLVHFQSDDATGDLLVTLARGPFNTP